VPRTTRAVPTAALALTVATLVPACGGGGTPQVLRPDVDQFRTGTCREAAPAVLALGDLGVRLRGAAAVPAGDRATLASEQKRLLMLHTSAELTEPVRALVTAIGFVRIRVDSNTYVPELMSTLVDEQQRLVARCTTG